jgi:hypothetical protein
MRYAHIFFGWSKRLKPNEDVDFRSGAIATGLRLTSEIPGQNGHALPNL